MIEHGYSLYSNNLCRCEICRSDWRVRVKEYRDRLKKNRAIPHIHRWRKHGSPGRVICAICRKTGEA